MAIIEFTEQKKRILVRRWQGSEENPRDTFTTTFATDRWFSAATIPPDAVAEFSINESEIEAYQRFLVERITESQFRPRREG